MPFPFKEPSPLPIGDIQKLKKETLPATEVKNHVLWVNPDFPEIPLDLPSSKQLKRAKAKQEQISSNLGIFLKSKDGERKVEIDSGHSRSGLLGRVIFKDCEGNLYRDVDAKGLGGSFVFGHARVVSNIVIREDGQSTGTVRKDYALHDRDMSEKLFSKGIRVVRVLGIIELEEIIPDQDGKKTSVKHAQAIGRLAPDTVPVLEIRAFGTHYRLSDPGKNLSDEEIWQAVRMLEDARSLVAAELSRSEKEFGWRDYFLWLWRTIGENLGRMHKNRMLHKYLTQGHNITLDGRIVDFDSVEELRESEESTARFDAEMVELHHAIKKFTEKFLRAITNQLDSENRTENLSGIMGEAEWQFIEAYEEENPTKES
jgi:hypothetical protein